MSNACGLSIFDLLCGVSFLCLWPADVKVGGGGTVMSRAFTRCTALSSFYTTERDVDHIAFVAIVWGEESARVVNPCAILLSEIMWTGGREILQN